MKFSVIVPSYNEEEDIAVTLAALEKLDYPNFEVLVVDDGSTDRTVEIVETFTNRLPHFRLLRQEKNRGAAAARNRGIQESSGEILVILNADVLPPSDFLKRILPYYQEGKKWVAVQSEVKNQERFYGRYIQAVHNDFITHRHWVWTESFSCAKEAAVQVGKFPESMPGCYGEDVNFGLNLEKKFPGTHATEIVVPHVTPDRLKTFWAQQISRGKGRTNYYFFLGRRGLFSLFSNSLLATVSRLLKVPTLSFRQAWRLCRLSPKKTKDFFPFLFAIWVQEAAVMVGIWKAYGSIVRNEKAGTVP